jgi:hypothetical protein
MQRNLVMKPVKHGHHSAIETTMRKRRFLSVTGFVMVLAESRTMARRCAIGAC